MNAKEQMLSRSQCKGEIRTGYRSTPKTKEEERIRSHPEDSINKIIHIDDQSENSDDSQQPVVKQVLEKPRDKDSRRIELANGDIMKEFVEGPHVELHKHSTMAVLGWRACRVISDL